MTLRRRLQNYIQKPFRSIGCTHCVRGLCPMWSFSNNVIIATPFLKVTINPICRVWLAKVFVHSDRPSSLPSGTLHTTVYLLWTKSGSETSQLSSRLLYVVFPRWNGSMCLLSSKVMPVSESMCSSIITCLMLPAACERADGAALNNRRRS